MGYEILRTKKIKSAGGLAGALKHAFREAETPNSNGKKNLCLVSNTSGEALERFNALLPEKHRKDAVRAIEYMISYSPGALNEQKGVEYLKDAQKWIEARHGKGCVIAGAVHLDETTPHLTCFVVPLVSGRLNAKSFVGGRATLSKMQTDFHAKVGERVGLERGVKHSRAHHEPVRRWYTLATSPTPPVKTKVPAPSPPPLWGLFGGGNEKERNAAIKKRNVEIRARNESMRAKALAFDHERNESNRLAQKVVELERENGTLRESIAKVKEGFEGLRAAVKRVVPDRVFEIIHAFNTRHDPAVPVEAPRAPAAPRATVDIDDTPRPRPRMRM
jgi:hypothetical protein